MVKDLSLYCEDEFNNGAETVEIVFGIVFAVGLAACLIAFQSTIVGAFDKVNSTLTSTFKTMFSPSASTTSVVTNTNANTPA